MKSVNIIGAGLSGLSLAKFLLKRNVKVNVFEASPRIGGRIQTTHGKLHTPLELGATWFSQEHFNLINLISELGLTYFPQHSEGVTQFYSKSFESPQQFYTPAPVVQSFRLDGGTSAIIETLYNTLPEKSVKINTRILEIQKSGNEILIIDAHGNQYLSDFVVCCVPPKLLYTQVAFSPPLPIKLADIMSSVHTWMSGAAKFVIEYPEPFWRMEGYSGTLYSQVGLITEMYDHSNAARTKFGLAGFLSDGVSKYSVTARKEAVVDLLTKLFGVKAAKYTSYFDKVWLNEFISGIGMDWEPAHHHNGHPLMQKAYMDGRLLFGGSETADLNPGYMDGAVNAAHRTAELILAQLNCTLRPASDKNQ